jgi:hypothetical protein
MMILALCFDGSLRAQVPPTSATLGALPKLSDFHALVEFIKDQLAQPQYEGLNPPEKRVISVMVVSAGLVIDSDRCADRSGMGGLAAWMMLLARTLNQSSGISDLSTDRKTQLVDMAMEIEARRSPAEDSASMSCHGSFRPELEVEPLSVRQAAARQALVLAWSPPKPEQSDQPHP